MQRLLLALSLYDLYKGPSMFFLLLLVLLLNLPLTIINNNNNNKRNNCVSRNQIKNQIGIKANLELHQQLLDVLAFATLSKLVGLMCLSKYSELL